MSRFTFANIIPVLLFIFFFSVTLVARFEIGTFMTSDDPFFHARMSHSLWHGEKVTMPRFSTQYTDRSNLYFLYHVSMSPLVGHCESRDYDCIIKGSQIFHSIIFGIFAVLVYVIFRRIMQSKSLPNSDVVALLLTLLMFAVSREYAGRMLMERPIAWGLIFVAVFLFALIRKKYYFIFLIPLAYVLSYSVAFMILAPAGIYLLVSLFFGRAQLVDGLKAFGLSTGGLLAGILVRPDSYGYIMNAFGSHILSIYQSLAGGGAISVPDEFGSSLADLGYSNNLWYWILGILIIYSLVRAVRLPRDDRGKIILIFVNVLTLSFMVLYAFFFRAIDYLFLFGFFAVVCNISYLYRNKPSNIFNMFLKKRKIIIVISIIFAAIFAALIIRPAIELRRNTWMRPFYNLDNSEIVEKIREDYNEGDLVFASRFYFYNKFIFYDPGISYPTGMDSSFTRLYDEEIFWKIHHVAEGEEICGLRSCEDAPTTTIYEFMKEDMGAKYILVNEYSKKDQAFAKLIREETRFVHIYTHKMNPYLYLYKVN